MMSKLKRRRRFKPRIRLAKPPGSRPGAVTISEDAPPPAIRVVCFNAEQTHEQEITNVADLVRLREKWKVTWVDVQGLGNAQLIRQIGEVFGLHALALEDVVHVHQRAKVEPYDTSLYIVLRAPDAHHATEQYSIFLGENFVVTFQQFDRDPFDPIRSALRQSTSQVRRTCRACYLAYRLMDTLIDSFFPVLETKGDRLDELDDLITISSERTAFEQLQNVKHDLLLIRRAVWPIRDAVNELLRDNVPYISESTQVYLRDCYDHTVQIIDLVETYREICVDLRDFYISTVSYRMNETMRVLTIIATIFIPLSFIAGVYGMNFDTETSPWNMPELHWTYGYPFALGLMAAMAGGMMVFFRLRGWFGGRKVLPSDGRGPNHGSPSGTSPEHTKTPAS